MAKKNFKGGLDGIISSTMNIDNEEKETRIPQAKTDPNNTSSNNTDMYISFHVKLKEEIHRNIKLRSVVGNQSIKDLVNNILEDYLKNNPM